MDTMELYNRVKQICEDHDLTISKLESIVGMSKGAIGKWRTSVPSLDNVCRIADYFGVSVDYLVGSTDIKQRSSQLIQDQDIYSIQRARERMTDKDKDRMMAILQIGFDYAFDDDQNKE